MQQPPTQDDLRTYLKEIGSIPLLTTEEEITLGKAVHCWQELEARIAPHLETYPLWAALELEQIDPDEYDRASKAGKRAKDKMVRSNLRLVVSIAKKYQDRGMELLDLIEEGNLGLIRGVEKFDPYRGFKFSTYAYWWVKQAITRGLGEKTRNIRLPIHITEKLNKRKKVCRLLSIELNRSPTIQEIADRMEMPLAQYQKLCEVGQKIASLDMTVGEEATLGEFIPADEQEPDFGEIKRAAQRYMSRLSGNQAKVIGYRFGLYDGVARSLGDIGAMLNLSRERVRQIEAKALQQLRSIVRRSGGHDRELLG
jgi:RNA polymerase nonessential primary-like sigma factor